MTTVRPLPRLNITRKSRKDTLTRRRSRQVPPNAVNDVSGDVSEQSIKDSEDAGFCGEPFADNGELLSSLSPLLFSMKLFGLYFHRQDRRPRPTDDPEWNAAPSTRISGLRVYATIVLILVWLNAVRLFSLFVKNDQFGASLLAKIMTCEGCHLSAIMNTAYYYASHSGKLDKVLLTLPVTLDCVRGARWVAAIVTTFIWIIAVVDLLIVAYIYFTAELDYMSVPFVTYIEVPEDKVIIANLLGYLSYIFVFPNAILSHAMTVVMVYVFYREFKKLKKHFSRAVGKRGRFSGDLSSFCRRHQMLSRAVNKVDGFLRFSNVGGFVCHIANIIILLYSIIFYRESTATLVSAIAHVFWIMTNVTGLLFSATASIIVNHVVRIRCGCVCCINLWYVAYQTRKPRCCSGNRALPL